MEAGQESKERDPAYIELPWYAIPILMVITTGVGIVVSYFLF